MPDRNHRHLYFKSGFVMNHRYGSWKHAQRQLQRLVPVEEVNRHLITTRDAIGLHIRNVFDAPRDAATNTSVVGQAAMAGAQQEYGVHGTHALLVWRRAAHWSNFVPRITSLIREHDIRKPDGLAQLHFYLAADSEAAYAGLTKMFPNRCAYASGQGCGRPNLGGSKAPERHRNIL